VASNAVGSLNSTPATLTVLANPAAPVSGQGYAYSVFTNNPRAYWRLNETLDPFTTTAPAYDISGHGFNGTYGTSVTVNNAGPAFLGFETGNFTAGFPGNVANGTITVPSLNLHTNTVTITAWINPYGYGPSGGGLVMNRDGANSSGLGFGSGNGLGYNWNDSANAYNFNSGLIPQPGIWSFVAVTITPTNATLYLYSADGGATNLFRSVNTVAHGPAAFSGGTTTIGGDSGGNNRTFNGLIGEVAVYGRTLGEVELQKQFIDALGGGSVSPLIITQPSPVNTFSGQTFRLNSGAAAYPTPGYQWQSGAVESGVFTNIPNAGNKSGANSATLTVNNSTLADALDYRLVAVNVAGSVESSPARVTLAPVPNNGRWTANFCIVNTANGNPGLPYVGEGILGNGTHWNPMAGYPSTSGVATLTDNGTTPVGITLTGANMSGAWASPAPVPGLLGLLGAWSSCNLSSGTTFTFANTPNGTYNLALYGSCAPYDDRGVTFTVNGVSQSLINAKHDAFIPGDNTALFTNVVVANGQLIISMISSASVSKGDTEGGFNGAQLQLIQGVGNPAHINSINRVSNHVVISGSSFDAGQSYRILSSTNLMESLANWIPVATNIFTGGTFTNTIPVNVNHPQNYYLLVEP
jgi:hypothetical protein